MSDFSGSLEGQTVCVIGGTAGIGRAIAAGAVRLGAQVIIAGRTLERAERVARDIGGITKGAAVDILAAEAIEHFFHEIGPIDHLVVTAAQVRGGPFKNGDVEAARASFEGKFWPQYLCAREADVRRSILLCSGTLSQRPWPGTSALAAVNGGVESLGRALAVELAPVRVNVISPGLIQGTDAYAAMPGEVREAMFDQAARQLPAGLVGYPDSVAGPALALITSQYATGTVLNIDGGGLLA